MLILGLAPIVYAFALTSPAMTHADPKTLFVHLGTEKTGTTSVQSVLARNEATLRAAGVSYVKAFRRGICHNHLTRLLREDRHDAHIRTKLSREIAQTHQRHLLISTETAFGTHDARKMISTLAGIDGVRLKPFFYFRRQDLFLESLAKQRGKTGQLVAGYLPFINARRQKADYAAFLRAMRRDAPQITWAAHLYDRAYLRGHDVVQDVFHHIGAGTMGLIEGGHVTANRTPSLAFLTALDQHAPATAFERQHIIRRAEAHARPAFFQSADVLTGCQREEIMDGFRTCNAQMSDEVGVDLSALFHDDVAWDRVSHAITDPDEWDWAVQAARLEIKRLCNLRPASATKAA
ncbi:hypothetical protein SAMN05444421_109129 [Celeribacter marinus]|uniref:Uncharacterized protein n=2 Tax=Celeribacter marinus TaxID=1397108 RepID=A0A0N9ZGS0_9RHOB|nr:hypothetical protein IMCC12053_2232 [Celeribacter marinus]SFK85758.1 hypothetical protein SAMN05444421_109129 [Celeribacter marinus]